MRDEAQHKQIHERLNVRETDELLDIWLKNDRVEWSDLAFEIIKEILQERSVAPPAQNSPVYEHQPQKKIPNKLKEFLAIGDDTHRLPAAGEISTIFYQPQKVILLQKWINLTMILAIVVNAARTIQEYANTQSYVSSILGSRAASNSIVFLIAGSITIFTLALQIALTVTALKGLSYILKILMQFEFNSRAASMKSTETG
jgi:hypothetical protein